jgi:hypothetical protein
MLRLRWATVIAGACIAIVAASTASAQTVINACVSNSDGTMRIVSGTTCKKNEALLSWNQQGPQGNAGAKGDVGPPGPRGPSEAYHARCNGNTAPPVPPTPAACAVGPLPAGKYVVAARMSLGTPDEEPANPSELCTLSLGLPTEPPSPGPVLIDMAVVGYVPIDHRNFGWPDNFVANASLGGPVTVPVPEPVPPAVDTIYMRCSGSAYWFSTLTAIRVERFVGVPQPPLP